MVKKQSFLSNLLGEETYENWVGYAKISIAVGTIVLLILFGLSYFFYSSIVSYLLKLVTGTSLLFIAYVAMWVLLLDIEVSVDEPEVRSWGKPKEVAKPISYILSTLWTIILIVLAIFAIYYSNRYRKQYAFECDTFLIDKHARLYHLDWTECDAIENAENLEEVQGYQIGSDFSLCDECKEIAEEAEVEYESDRYFRR
jgi:hypothetical protein